MNGAPGDLHCQQYDVDVFAERTVHLYGRTQFGQPSWRQWSSAQRAANIPMDRKRLMSQMRWIFISVIVVGFCIWYLTPLRSPSKSQIVGHYQVALSWGEASLSLNADQTFTEVVHVKTGESHEVTGKWSLNSGWQSGLVLEPYWQFTQDDLGRKVENTALPVESWWFRGVRIELGDPDSGLLFRKQ